MSIVRASLYRHVFGEPFKAEFAFQNIRPNVGAWDSNWIAANALFVAVPWQGGGGSVAVLNQKSPGKQPADLPLVSGHTGAVLDLKFHPFNQYIMATGSVDATAKVWSIPQEGLTTTLTEPSVNLEGHMKKVGLLEFHPTANNVLLTAGQDHKVVLWDIESGKSQVEMRDLWKDIQSISFNKNGSLFASTSKDKKLRIIDPRKGSVALEVEGHGGTKGSRVQWITNTDRLFSVGFSKTSERQYMMWDPRSLEKPLTTVNIDMASGLIMPFYDPDTNLMFLAGKGDGNIRYLEITNEEPYIHSLSEFRSTDPQMGMAMLPKIAVDTTSNEIIRLFKLTANQITPISFTVPRKSELFQSDIYPKTASPSPALSASDYFSGQDAELALVSMNPEDKEIDVQFRDFKPNVEVKAKQPKTVLPSKTSNPQELLKQNEELRQRVEALEKENWNLQQELKKHTEQ